MSPTSLVARAVPATNRGPHATSVPWGKARNVMFSALVLGVFVGSGCSSLRVQSLPDPMVGFQGQTFYIPEAPEDSVSSFRTADPMLNNSIIDRVVRATIRQSFEARGYRMTDDDPDFIVGYYTRARERLDLSNVYDCGYGYGYYNRYNYGCYIDEYTEGMVIVDVIDPKSEELVWRGSGVARVSDNPNKYLNQLGKAIGEIVQRDRKSVV